MDIIKNIISLLIEFAALLKLINKELIPFIKKKRPAIQSLFKLTYKPVTFVLSILHSGCLIALSFCFGSLIFCEWLLHATPDRLALIIVVYTCSLISIYMIRPPMPNIKISIAFEE